MLYTTAPLLLCGALTLASSQSGGYQTATGPGCATPLLARFTVVIASDASPGEVFAARELSNILGNLTDPAFSPEHMSRPLPNTSDLSFSGPRFAVGWRAATQNLGLDPRHINDTLLRNDGFLLWGGGGGDFTSPSCSGHSCVALTGARTSIMTGKRGALYAVYEFLHQLGVRFFSHDETRWPPTVSSLPAATGDKLVVPQPQVVHRDMLDGPAWMHPLFARRSRLVMLGNDKDPSKTNGGGPLDHSLGPPYADTTQNDSQWTSYRYSFPGGSCHSIYRLLGGFNYGDQMAPPAQLFKEHPSWFWPRNASVYGQVCWHNQSLQRFLIKQVKMYLALNPDVEAISVTQNDNTGFCEDPEEQAIVAKDGSRIGPMLRVVNAVADAIRVDYPHVLVDTFAYLFTLPVPRVTRPRDNVVIRICTASCNFAAPYTDPVNKMLHDTMSAWGKIAKHLAVWDYITNFRMSICVCSSFALL
jgi:hypothetical protein